MDASADPQTAHFLWVSNRCLTLKLCLPWQPNWLRDTCIYCKCGEDMWWWIVHLTDGLTPCIFLHVWFDLNFSLSSCLFVCLPVYGWWTTVYNHASLITKLYQTKTTVSPKNRTKTDRPQIKLTACCQFSRANSTTYHIITMTKNLAPSSWQSNKSYDHASDMLTFKTFNCIWSQIWRPLLIIQELENSVNNVICACHLPIYTQTAHQKVHKL